VDGDVFVLLTETGGRPKLQTISCHRLNLNEPNNNIWDGVRLDANDRPTRYIVDESRSIAPRDIIHLFDPHSFDAVRGAPSTAHAINNMFDVREILALEKKGVKLNSAIATVIKTPSPTEGEGFLGEPVSNNNDSTTLESIISGGVVPRLQPGEDITSFTSSRPSPTFDGFIEHFVRDFAVGIGLPLEFIWTASALGGTAQRFVLQKAQRRFEQRQEVLTKALTRIWQWFVAKRINDGLLPSNDEWRRVGWQTPRKITVDSGRESKATIEEVKMGLTGYKEDYASRGKDWREELRQRAEEERFLQELADENGINRERISQRFTNLQTEEE